MGKILTAALLAAVAAAAVLVGCGKTAEGGNPPARKYSVDYHGQENLFQGAKPGYAAGDTVKLRYDLIATDTDYTFYVDGETFNADWDGGAYVLKFKMPEHDIEVYCEHHNSMVNEPVPDVDPETEAAYTSITMEEAAAIFAVPGDYCIVDVRRADEFAEGHIPGAVNIANEDIDTEPPEALPEPDKTIYVYCRSGRRSKLAAEKLAAMGYANIIEFGGILDWPGEIEK